LEVTNSDTKEEDANNSLYTEEGDEISSDTKEDITNSDDTEEEEDVISSDNEEEEEEGLSSSFHAAVDALPQALICREEEKGDEEIMCAICC